MTTSRSFADSETYLLLMEELTLEVERAMVAVRTGALGDFEQSLVRQQACCAHLAALQRSFGCSSPQRASATSASVDPVLGERIRAAAAELAGVTRHYAMLLKHFGGTARLFAGMFRGYGNAGATSLQGLQARSAWSCEL